MSPLRASTLSVVGAGVMAEAIIAGVLERQLVSSGSIVASHPRADRRQALGEKYGIHVTADNAEAPRRGVAVGLGTKPRGSRRGCKHFPPTRPPATRGSRSMP